jgi:tetratricopeptide (TPR) repeat protein
MWVSAASTLPPIALVGGSGLLTVFLRGRSARGTGAVFAAQAWRTWGRVGGGASFAFYLLEYFPSHLGWRLEANHPLYALAWLGGGELIAEIAEWWLAAPAQSRLAWRRLAWPLLTVLAPPLVILIGGQKVFILLDPFLARLHSNYIQEFLPIWRVVRGANATMIFQVILVDCLPLLAGLATLSFLRREAPIVLWFATLAGLLFNLMAWWQSRWLLNSSGVQICLALVLLATWTRSAKPALRWLIAIALVGTLYVPSCVIRLRGSANEVRLRRVGPRDAVNALYRDIAGALRASQPAGEITLLASPNGSTNIGYYGRFRTLGTLYWENRDGLKAAAAIFSARPDGEAPALLRRHHVTHIAIVSEENFIQPYFELLNPGAPAAQVTQGLGYRLLVEKSIPQWLEVIPYRLPDDLRSLNITVMLFKVNFEQSLPDALYRVALAQLAQGEIEVADHTLDQVIAQAPQAYQPWLRKGELLLARHRWNDAAEAMAQGIALAPAAERPALSTAAAKSFYEQHQHAIAIRIYEASLRDHPTADNACYLAWILATSRDQSLRDGTQALQLARQAVKANPNSSTFLITLAAALAETGRWPEAVTAADQALANSRLDGSPASIQQVFQQRLEQLKSGQPLRN